MEKILSAEELNMHLNNFRSILEDINCSHMYNVSFINLESIYIYIENLQNTSCSNHCLELEKNLNILEPYLPFLSYSRAEDFLIQLCNVKNDNEIESLKEDYKMMLKLDFINKARKITCQEDWVVIKDICQKIRYRKSHSHLH